jgi:hypothetical protein
VGCDVGQVREGGTEDAELAHDVGASVTRGDVATQRGVLGCLGVACGERGEALVVRMALVQHALGPDALIG